MRKVGACLAIAALAATTLAPSPAAAFGLRLGPFHLGLPFFGPHHRGFHRRHVALRASSRAGLYDRINPAAANPAAAPAQRAEPALFYPAAGLPTLFEQVFWPARAPQWPFGYDAIFSSAFAKSPLDENAQACREPDRSAEVVARIRDETSPNPAQADLLQKLGRALGMASGYLARACPSPIPAQPVARLTLMQSQIQALSMAIDLVRPPLQQFEQSLDARQQARFAAASNSGSASAECGTAPAAIDWSVSDIDQSVQPGSDQRAALSDLKQTFVSVAGDLHAHCPNPLPVTPLARLQAIEGRLDASWRAALAMQVALAAFESHLTDQQKNRFEAMNLAQAR
jgi:LTXXQ motif family protein